MTVRAIVPIIDYTGDGATTKYDWDWDMIEDSSINVLVDNENVTNWTEEGQSVVFNPAPDAGAEIRIYRRTKIWMPENYRPFGRFHSEKTELSVDRAILIAQERAGDRNGNTGTGIVGGANLSITRGEFNITVVSERGTDAVIPMYNPDDEDITAPGDPDITIATWEGDPIIAGIFDAALPSTPLIRFYMNTDYAGDDRVINGTDNVINGIDNVVASSGLSLGAFAEYPNFNALETVQWCTVDPSDNEYWMRVTAAAAIPPTNRYQIYDPWSGTVALGESFQIRSAPVVPFDVIVLRDGEIVDDGTSSYIFPRDASAYEEGVYGPYVSVTTTGDSAPSTRKGTFNIEICKDDGTGQPDNQWASRIVSIESIYNSAAVTNPPDSTIAVWEGMELFANRTVSAPVYTAASTGINFNMSFLFGDPAKVDAEYQFNTINKEQEWCTVDPASGDYWMRVSQVGTSLPTGKYYIYDGASTVSLDTAFPMLDGGTEDSGPSIIVRTNGDPAPANRTGRFKIEICSDDGAGFPDDNWAVRYVTLQAILLSEPTAPPPSAVDTTGAVTFESFFGSPLSLSSSRNYRNAYYGAGTIIPAGGISIWFTVPSISHGAGFSFTSLDSTAISTSRTGSVNQTVGDYTADPTYTWLAGDTGGGIICTVNGFEYSGSLPQIELVPGNTYILNIRNNTPSPTLNYIIASCNVST